MSNRLLRVRELLKREIGAYLQREYEFGNALVSIHDVDLTPDLKRGHVYLGVIGDDEAKESVVERLNADRGVIQRAVSKRVVLKFTPQLEFHVDDSIERGVRVLDLLEGIEVSDDDEILAESESQGSMETNGEDEDGGEEPTRENRG